MSRLLILALLLASCEDSRADAIRACAEACRYGMESYGWRETNPASPACVCALASDGGR